MFKRRVEKDYADIIAEVETGSTREAHHLQPTSIEAEGLESLITEAQRAVFDDFVNFGRIFNQQLFGPWSVEEEPSPLLGWLDDMPDHGRNYRVFYNRVEMGSLMVGLGHVPWEATNDRQKYDANRNAKALLQLHYLQFVPYQQAHSILFLLGMFFATTEAGEVMRAKANAAATAALTAHLWEVVRAPDEVGGFAFWCEGPYPMVLDYRDWRRST